jgi:hypothetical protein
MSSCRRFTPAFAVLLFGCAHTPAVVPAADLAVSEEEVFRALDQVFPVAREYRCGPMVRAVNSLRHLGKCQALGMLFDYINLRLHEEGGDERELVVSYVCRLLFASPAGGWGYGEGDRFFFNMSVVDASLPLFPLAVSDHVPFMVVTDITLEGFLMKTWGYQALNICENLELISQDYSATGFDKAANDLLADPKLQKLYTNDQTRQYGEALIKSEAGLKNF